MRTGIGGNDQVADEIGCDGDFLATFDDVSARAVSKVEFDTAVGRGNERFTFLKDIPDTQFA
ncbi:hypothetical protein HaloA020_36560 [Halomonas sp. A020]|nr:hypothetical protein HaloA020_36560 [Halomonas sp. A020]